MRIRSGRPRARQVDLHDLDDPARPRAHHRDDVGEEHRLRDAVRDHQRGGRPLGPDPQQLDVQPLAGHVVERAERLVEQHHRRLHDQAAGDRHPLAHAAGQLRGLGLLEAGEPDQLDQVVDQAGLGGDARRPPAAAGCCRRRCATAAAPPPGRRCRARGRAGSPGSDRPLISAVPEVGLLQAGEDAQDRRLAAARRAEQRQERVLHGAEVDGGQRVDRCGGPGRTAWSGPGCRSRSRPAGRSGRAVDRVLRLRSPVSPRLRSGSPRRPRRAGRGRTARRR